MSSNTEYGKWLDWDRLIQDIWMFNRPAQHNEERYKEALDGLNAMIATNPNNPAVWQTRGQVLFILGRFEEAVDSYDKALTIDPSAYKEWYTTIPDVWYARGQALVKLGRFEEAVDSFDKAIAKNPKYGDALNARGQALVKLGRFEEALVSYDNLIAYHTIHADHWYERGGVLKELKRYEEAGDSYDRAMKLDCTKELPFAEKKELLRKIQIEQQKHDGEDKRTPVAPIINISGGRDVHIGNKIEMGDITNIKTKISDSVVQRSTIGAKGNIDDNKCPDCGAELNGREKFCPECGQKVR